MRIRDIVWNEDDHSVNCGGCGTRLSGDDENWKVHALVNRNNAAERLNNGDFGPAFGVYEHPGLELAEIFCPECKQLLTVELYLKDEPLRWTYRSLSVAAGQGYDAAADFKENPDQWISFGSAS